MVEPTKAGAPTLRLLLSYRLFDDQTDQLRTFWRGLQDPEGRGLEICAFQERPSEPALAAALGACDAGIVTLFDNLRSPAFWDGLDAARGAEGLRLKTLSTYSVGYEHIDLGAARARGLTLGYTPNLSEAVAEFTLALTLAGMRRLWEGGSLVARGEWPSATYRADWMSSPTLMSNAVIGIIGMGRIGRLYGAMVHRAFGSRITYHNRRRASAEVEAECGGAEYRASVHELVRDADVIVVLCPLTEATRHIVDAAALTAAKPTAVLVNTSRGGTVDQEALVAALSSGEIGGAALDVVSPEPLSGDHPLLRLRNCLVVPHIGSASIPTRRDMFDSAMSNALCPLLGREGRFPLAG